VWRLDSSLFLQQQEPRALVEHCSVTSIGTILGKTTESGGRVTHTHRSLCLG